MKLSNSSFLKLSGIILGCLAITSCGPAREEIDAKEKAHANSVSVNETSAALEANQKKEIAFKADSGRVFVRTADLHFKVKDVKLATFDIERIVRDNRGYVTSTSLESSISYRNSVRISKDSLKETIRYKVYNDIVIRVPNSELDKALSEIAALFDYLDHRRVYAQDITKDLQLAALSQNNFKNHKQRVEKAIDKNGSTGAKTLNATVEAEDALFDKQALANQEHVDTKELDYSVAYSTIKIAIYQNESNRSEVLAFSEPVKPYEPPFSEKLSTALSTGGSILGEILLFFIRLWPIWLLAAGCWFLAKRIARLKWFN